MFNKSIFYLYEKNINSIGLINFIRLVEMKKKTRTLKIKSKDSGFGYLYFRNGELMDAKTDTLKGVEAVLDILSWEDVVIKSKRYFKYREKGINSSIFQIMMERDNAQKEKLNTSKIDNINLEVKMSKEEKKDMGIMEQKSLNIKKPIEVNEKNLQNNQEKDRAKDGGRQKMNTILKGSKLLGDINISFDLELSGEVEGNINSEKDSNIVITGICKGNVQTKEGNVNIEGELINGNIYAGGDVIIPGKFDGGNVKAQGKIFVNGEFNGKLEANEIEVGPNSHGKGELLYKDSISISKGAKVELQINQIQEKPYVEKPYVEKKSAEMKVVSIEPAKKEVSGVN